MPIHSRSAAGVMIAALGVSWLAPNAGAQTGFVNFETPHVSPLTLTPSGARLLAVNTADGRLEVFSVIGGVPVWESSIPVGLEPVSVRCRDENEVWVVNHLSDTISVVDLASRRLVRTIATGDEPADVVFAGSPVRAYVTVAQLNQVRVYDPANPGLAPTIVTIQGEEPRALAVSPDGSRVYAAIFESGNATGAVRQQDVSAANGPYAGQNPPPNSGNQFSPALAAGLQAPPPVAQIVRRNAAGVWRDDNGRNWSSFVTWNLHDHDVAIISTSNLGVTYASGMMTTVMGLGVKPDGTVTAIGTEAKNEIRFEPNVKSIFVRCTIGGFNPASPASTTVADLNPHLDYLSRSIPQAQRNQSIGDPRGIVWHPTSGHAYVSGMGSNSVIVTDEGGDRFAQIDVGQGPTGLALSADGTRLYVLNRFEGSVSAVDTGGDTEVARVPFFDPTTPAIKVGRPLMYDTHRTSGLGQVSCASCHIDSRTDFLAWDLGDPSGAMKENNQDCRQPVCNPWHPMKGPMVTQTLQGIVGSEPFHWRGDRENVAAFAPAFTGLQGADAQPSAAEMQQLTDFVATIVYQPNPNRNLDGTMPASIATSGGGNGNPNTGLNLYRTLPVLPGGVTCVSCHTLPAGTSQQIDNPPLPLAPQPLKTVQLRGLYEKVGWLRNGQNNSKGFGFNHHSEFDTLNALLNAGFNFGPPQQAVQGRRDVEAFLLCFDTETHAAVGQQVTFDGSNNSDATLVARLATLTNLADQGRVGLIAKGRVNGLDRGYQYMGSQVLQSDRAAETTTASALRQGAAAGEEITFTVVPAQTQRRAGIDRDADGFLDRDEWDAGSDAADAASTPLNSCRADFDRNGWVNGDDFDGFTAAFEAGSILADIDHNTFVNGDDFDVFVAAFEAGC